ncbi:MAG: hypothetical protein JSR33_04055 [Proteobacteria bacterium]|nr:hypothetical protein [Pseudomonadota bacterium]
MKTNEDELSTRKKSLFIKGLEYIAECNCSPSAMMNIILDYSEINRVPIFSELRSLDNNYIIALITFCYFKYEGAGIFLGNKINYIKFRSWVGSLLLCDDEGNAKIYYTFEEYFTNIIYSLDGAIYFGNIGYIYKANSLPVQKYERSSYRRPPGLTLGHLTLLIIDKLYRKKVTSEIGETIKKLENQYLVGNLSLQFLNNTLGETKSLLDDRELFHLLDNKIITEPHAVNNDSSRRMAETMLCYFLFKSYKNSNKYIKLIHFKRILSSFFPIKDQVRDILAHRKAIKKISCLMPEGFSISERLNIEMFLHIALIATGYQHVETKDPILKQTYLVGIYSLTSRAVYHKDYQGTLNYRLFLQKKYDLKTCQWLSAGTPLTIFLTNENHAYLFKLGQLFLQDGKPVIVKNIHRGAMMYNTHPGEKLIECDTTKEQTRKIIEQVILGTGMGLAFSNKSGILRSTDPAPFYMPEIAIDQKNVIEDRCPDRSMFDDAKLPFPQQLFSSNIYPFVNSISGTMLCLVRVYIAVLRHCVESKDGQFFEREFFRFYLRNSIAILLALEGGHSLYEFFACLEVPEVKAEIAKALPGITLDMPTLFGGPHYSAAIRISAKHASILFYKQQINQEIIERPDLVLRTY